MSCKDDGVQVFCVLCDIKCADIPHRYAMTDEICWYCRDCFRKHIQHCEMKYE